MRIKRGVRLSETMAIWAMLTTAKEVVEDLGVEFVLTSGTDGAHMPRSLHRKGRAIDFRTRKMLRNAKHRCAQEIRRRLGDSFDVVIETDHIHLEFDPKK